MSGFSHRAKNVIRGIDYPHRMNRILASARYAVVIPSFASILSALLLMIQGSVEMIRAIVDVGINGTNLKLTIVAILTAVDGILLGTVLLVIGYGLYELFIDQDLDVPASLLVRDLDDLKSKLTGVVVAIISVIFVGVFVDTTRASDVIACGVGAGAILTGLAFFAFASRKEESEKGKRS